MNVECYSNRRATSTASTASAGGASAGRRQTARAPARRGESITGSKGGESRSITPRQVRRTRGRTRALVELLGQTAVGGCVLSIDGDKPIRKGLDGGGQGLESGCRTGIGTSGDVGGELTEEG